MSTNSDHAKTETAKPTADQMWKPVAGSEQDTHSQTPGGGEDAKHGTKDPADAKTAHASTRKGEQG